MSGKAVYLDYAATTPTDPRVIDAMLACSGVSGTFANPASAHVAGRAAARVVATARERLAQLLNCDPGRLIFTSGATESDNLAIRGAAAARSGRGRHLITMPTEHKAVTDTFKSLEREGYEVSWLRPAADGLLDLQSLHDAMRDETQLVSVMHVNNETGVIQDIRSIGALCRDRDVLFHTDAAQSAGKLPIDLAELPVDLLSLTAHKFYGPQGVGALYIADRPACAVFPLMFGGGQEKRLRPGTLPVHLAAGMGAAAAIAAKQRRSDMEKAQALRDRLWRGLADMPGIAINGSVEAGYPGILNVSADGVEGESLLLGMEPVCVASGSACNAVSGEPSHVLRALGRSDLEAQSAIRFSVGRFTTANDVDTAVECYRRAVERLRDMAPVP
jgi:cysteine desulfurase